MILWIYAPQVRLDAIIKDAVLWWELQCTVVNIGESENLFLCGDSDGHIGSSSAGYDDIHGGFGIGERNVEGERILEFSVAHDLVICNSFQKRTSHLVTYHSGCRDLKLVSNTEIFPGKGCALQHKLRICDL